MRNLLKTLNTISYNNVDDVASVKAAMEERLDFLDDREPESDGMVHDEWEEKHDLIEEIIESLESYEEEANEMQEHWDAAVDMILEYQACYGGLSRIKI